MHVSWLLQTRVLLLENRVMLIIVFNNQEKHEKILIL